MATKRTMSAKNKKIMAGGGATLGGFTIIEVVLVLAIAGLIFLMVFIALPQLQAAQRNTQRREDMSKLNSAIVQFQANNNGKIPNQNATYIGVNQGNFVSRYIVGDFVDPDGEDYNVEFVDQSIGDANSHADNAHTMVVVNRAYCDGENAAAARNVRDYAILYKLENSGVYCIDNGGTAAGAGEGV